MGLEMRRLEPYPLLLLLWQHGATMVMVVLVMAVV